MSRIDGIELQSIVDSEIIDIARRDPRQIIENFFKIVDKYGKVVPFLLNPPQEEYYNEITYRDDILKARKEGFSSLILAILAVKFLFLENVNCVCISHEEDSTKRLFQKVEFYIENLTSITGEKISVDLSSKSKKDMVYKFFRKDDKGNIYPVTNTFYIGTAGSKAFGRGDNIHYLHCSEHAFWENASVLMTGLLNAVPDDRDSTFIVKESTANGIGNQHHSEWIAENEKRSSFTPHFFGWHKDPTNQLSLIEYKERTGGSFVQTDPEIRLAVKYGLSLEQLAWRRWKITSMQPDDKRTKEDLFMQEFPIDDREAFLSSGKPIFDLKAIEWYEEAMVRTPEFVGDLMGWNPPFFSDNSEGELMVWSKPDIKCSYAIAADVAEIGDFCYATVINKQTYEQVAEYNGHMDEFEFAAFLYRLGYWYNKGLLGVERNNQGIAVVKKLDELGYPNQYRRESIDEITKTVHNELGWRTDMKTRPIMISDFNQDITNRRYRFRSKLLASQMRTFVRNKSGRAEAQSNCHDDAVIGNCIAVQMIKILPETIQDEELAVRDYRPNTSIYNLLRK